MRSTPWLLVSAFPVLLSAFACDPAPPPAKAPEGPVAPAKGVACEKEVGLVCPEGQEDGCPKTTVHICIPKNQTGGPACELEIARVCDAGFVDACTLTPSPAKNHICVAR
jgi:hypothetical protein